MYGQYYQQPYYQQQPYYDQSYYDSPKISFSNDQIKNLVIGGVLLLVHLLVILNLTLLCGSDNVTRKFTTFIYGWIVAFTAIAITIGSIGVIAFIVSFVPFPITMMIASMVSMLLPISFSVISLVIGSYGTSRAVAVLNSLKDIKCEEPNKDSAMQTAYIAIFTGAVLVFLGFKPLKY